MDDTVKSVTLFLAPSTLRTQPPVRGLAITYATAASLHYGATKGTKHAFTLHPNEHITRIAGVYDASTSRAELSTFQITTNMREQLFGLSVCVREPRRFSYAAQLGHQVVGIRIGQRGWPCITGIETRRRMGDAKTPETLPLLNPASSGAGSPIFAEVNLAVEESLRSLSEMLAGADPKHDTVQLQAVAAKADAAARQLAQARDSFICTVCTENPVSQALVPCGHAVLCPSCIQRLEGRDLRCPVCRSSANAVMTVYYQ